MFFLKFCICAENRASLQEMQKAIKLGEMGEIGEMGLLKPLRLLGFRVPLHLSPNLSPKIR
jgi:hypothetical protein